MLVILPASHLEPGVVLHEARTCAGILDAGRYPGGVDGFIETVTADLTAAGFSARPDPRAMRLKYAKLLDNLQNALQAVTRVDDTTADLLRRANHEALACYAAAGIDCASREEYEGRRRGLLQLGPIEGRRRAGGSSWQSLSRGTGNIEADYLNGEIVLLGRLHGIPTPVNQALQELANRQAALGAAPAALPAADVLELVRALEAGAEPSA
jgi:2-dehydropantoate 2-reductase